MVEPCLTHHSVFIALLQKIHAVLRPFYYILREVLHEDTAVFFLTDRKRLIPCGVLQQIVNFFIVNLQETAVDGELFALGFTEQVVDCVWDYPKLRGVEVLLFTQRPWDARGVVHLGGWIVYFPIRSEHRVSLA